MNLEFTTLLRCQNENLIVDSQFARQIVPRLRYSHMICDVHVRGGVFLLPNPFVACDLLTAHRCHRLRIKYSYFVSHYSETVRVRHNGKRHSNFASTLNCVCMAWLLSCAFFVAFSLSFARRECVSCVCVLLICLHLHLNPRDAYHRHRTVFAYLPNTLATCFCFICTSSEHTRRTYIFYIYFSPHHRGKAKVACFLSKHQI